jgi:hypothetical protein
MMSSSEVQRITLSAKKVVTPTGAIELEEWDDDRESEDADNNPETDEGNENTTMEATTPISAAESDTAVNKTGKKNKFFKNINLKPTIKPRSAFN